MRELRVLVVAPHPDDETLAAGGTICLHARRGDSILVVFVTSGEMVYRFYGLKGPDPSEVARLKEEEAKRALRVLGVSEDRLLFLRFPDTRVAEHVEELSARLSEVVRQFKPDVVYAPHSAERHSDHHATHHAVLRALERERCNAVVRMYVVWGDLPRATLVLRLPSDVVEKKRRALEQYRSQISILGWNFFSRFLRDKEEFDERQLSQRV